LSVLLWLLLLRIRLAAAILLELTLQESIKCLKDIIDCLLPGQRLK
jgi:hypothetical protein